MMIIYSNGLCIGQTIRSFCRQGRIMSTEDGQKLDHSEADMKEENMITKENDSESSGWGLITDMTIHIFNLCLEDARQMDDDNVGFKKTVRNERYIHVEELECIEEPSREEYKGMLWDRHFGKISRLQTYHLNEFRTLHRLNGVCRLWREIMRSLSSSKKAKRGNGYIFSSEFIKDHHSFRYSRNNIGPDGNILNMFTYMSGRGDLNEMTDFHRDGVFKQRQYRMICIYESALCGQRSLLEFALKNFPIEDKEIGITLIRKCVEKGMHESVDLLLNYHNVNAFLFNQEDLYRAVESDDLRLVRFIMRDETIDPSYHDNTILRNIHIKDLEMLDFLLRHPRTDVSKNNESLLIHYCCNPHKTELASMLLKIPTVNPSVRNNNPLKVASVWNSHSGIRLLLQDERVDPSVEKNALVIDQCKSGNPETAELFLSHPKVDINECYESLQDIVNLNANQLMTDMIVQHPRFIQAKRDMQSLVSIPDTIDDNGETQDQLSDIESSRKRLGHPNESDETISKRNKRL